MSLPSTVLNLQCAPIPTVRIALIGVGNRGMKTLLRYAYVQHAEIRYLADINADALEAANEALAASGRPKATTLCGKDGWQEACCRTDVDLVYICTDWHTHTPMAVFAMNHGKHVAVEVPAATSVDECWQLVHTSQQTRRHCFMAENCCYDFFALNTYEMHRQGVFGKIVHCEGAYIHDLTDKAEGHPARWMAASCQSHGGNPYPTHGIGPIAKLLGFHKGDRMVRLSSLTSTHDAADGDFNGNINTSLIQTANGVTITLQLDVTTPRPYSRIQTICGTRGYAQKYPLPTLQTADGVLTGQAALDRMNRYAVSESSLLWKQGSAMGVENAMNYVMDSRLIQALHRGQPLDIDVYDAAEWSCLAELTQISARNGAMPVDIPDFLAENR